MLPHCGSNLHDSDYEGSFVIYWLLFELSVHINCSFSGKLFSIFH